MEKIRRINRRIPAGCAEVLRWEHQKVT
jgi:hypothetical protein